MLRFMLTFIALAILPPPLMSNPVLENYVNEGLRNNLTLQQRQLDYQNSIQKLRQARALFFPAVALNASYTVSEGGRAVDIPIGDLLNPVYHTLNQLTGSDRFPTIANTSTQFLPDDYQETYLEFSMPIFNSDIYFNYKANKALVSMTNARRQAYQNELTFEIRSAYFRYLQAQEAVKIYRNTRMVMEELLRVNRKLVENQMATIDAVYSAEAELSQIDGQIAVAEKNHHVARAYFNFLLNRNLQAEILIDDQYDFFFADSLTTLSNHALVTRQEIRQLGFALEAARQKTRLHSADALLPKVFLGGQIGYQGNEFSYDNESDYWLLQFGLRWDLFRGFEKRAKIAAAAIEQRALNSQLKMVALQIELEIIESYHALEAAQKALAAATAGERSAQKSFNIIHKKYQQQQALLVELLEARNRLTNAGIARAIAQYDLFISTAALQKAIAR